MIQGQLPKGKITAWLLPVVLVLGLFSFSCVSASTAAERIRANTEQVESVRIVRKKGVAFSDVVLAPKASAGVDWVQRIDLHNLLVKIQIDKCDQICNCFVPISQLLLPALHFSPEEFSFSHVG